MVFYSTSITLIANNQNTVHIQLQYSSHETGEHVQGDETILQFLLLHHVRIKTDYFNVILDVWTK